MTTHTQHDTTLIQIRVPTQEVMENIMGASWDTWSWWTEVTYADGCDWNKYPATVDAPYVTVSIQDPDMDDDTVTVTHATLTVRDIVQTLGECLMDYPHIRWDDMDACSADLVIQEIGRAHV